MALAVRQMAIAVSTSKSATSRSLYEPITVLSRVHEPFHHLTWVAGPIQLHNPVRVQRIRVAPQIAKVLHHHERLVVELPIDLRAFRNLLQHLSTRRAAIGKRVDQRLPVSQSHAR